MEKVLEKHNLAKLSQEAIRNLKTLFENQRNLIHNQNLPTQGFPGGAVVENLPANVGDMGSSPGLGRSHMPWSN